MTLINERLNTTEVFLNPANASPFADIAKSLTSIVNARTLTAKLRRGVSGGSTKTAVLARGIWNGLQKVGLIFGDMLRISYISSSLFSLTDFYISVLL